jgi:hypothetical protein
MRCIAAMISFFAILIVVMPTLVAEDKKEPVKTDIKEADKKDPDKKDAKKEGEKKDDEKKDAKKTDEKKTVEKPKKKEPKTEPEESVLSNPFLKGKVRRVDSNSTKGFTIAVPFEDPMKVFQVNVWKMNEMNRIAQINPREVVNRAQQMTRFQLQLVQKLSNDIYSNKDVDLRAGDTCKVRALSPPIEFDDKGKLKIYTQKELKALRGTSKLPGYPAEFDRVAEGQIVTVYLAKPKVSAKGEAALTKKKNADDEDASTRPEAVMILVEQEAPPRQN